MGVNRGIWEWQIQTSRGGHRQPLPPQTHFAKPPVLHSRETPAGFGGALPPAGDAQPWPCSLGCPRQGHFVTAVTLWVPSHSGHPIPVHPDVTARFGGTQMGQGVRSPQDKVAPSAPETKRKGIRICGANPGVIYSHTPQNSATVEGKNPALF